MKYLKQIREDNKSLLEKPEDENKKLTALIRAGLYDVKKMPLLKRALSKDNVRLTSTERTALLDLLDSLMDQVVKNRSVYAKVKQNLQINEENKKVVKQRIPFVLVLKRKSIRQFPDATVALYYSDALKKVISVPFTDIGIADLPVNEETNFNIIKYFSENDEKKYLVFSDGNTQEINKNVSEKILSLYESVNENNKKKIETMLEESVDSYKKIVEFAVRQ